MERPAMKLLTSVVAAAAILALSAPAGAHPRDRDNNPPGWRGGPGTNWENPPGPRGGPGASPDRWRNYHWNGRHWRAERWRWRDAYWYWHPYRGCWALDPDDNPPGPTGGPGTNWENPPGPVGGPGASPDRTICR